MGSSTRANRPRAERVGSPRASKAARTPVTAPAADSSDLVKRAAVDVIAETGLGSFSIREVARRAGLSHAAPGYLFGDTQGLLTAVAVEGFVTLHAELTHAAEGIDDPVERLIATGKAYVRVALRYPAHCEVMFRTDVVRTDDPELETVGLRAFTVLEDAVRSFAAEHNPELDIHTAARLCWSSMQGLVQLRQKLARLDSLTDRSFDIERESEALSRLIITGLTAR
jgi:AcrR family transcriptional regulator